MQEIFEIFIYVNFIVCTIVVYFLFIIIFPRFIEIY